MFVESDAAVSLFIKMVHVGIHLPWSNPFCLNPHPVTEQEKHPDICVFSLHRVQGSVADSDQAFHEGLEKIPVFFIFYRAEGKLADMICRVKPIKFEGKPVHIPDIGIPVGLW